MRGNPHIPIFFNNSQKRFQYLKGGLFNMIGTADNRVARERATGLHVFHGRFYGYCCKCGRLYNNGEFISSDLALGEFHPKTGEYICFSCLKEYFNVPHRRLIHWLWLKEQSLKWRVRRKLGLFPFFEEGIGSLF